MQQSVFLFYFIINLLVTSVQYETKYPNSNLVAEVLFLTK